MRANLIVMTKAAEEAWLCCCVRNH